jgi:Fe(II)/alpha-ketoglutarate-dependent arginine beta-hydroxylase
MEKVAISRDELGVIQPLLDDIARQYRSAEDHEFLKDARIWADGLPRRLRVCLNDFKMLEPPSSVCLISNYQVDDSRIGATPAHWRRNYEVSPTLREEILFVLFGSLLGDIFGWESQQDGYIVHEVVPIKAHENEQISSGSKQLITWHNEDAFHAYRGDYVGLMCLRNPDAVATTIAAFDVLTLDANRLATLFEPRFIIHPDISHLLTDAGNSQHQTNPSEAPLGAVRPRVNRANGDTEKVAVLYGDPQSPYLRLDPYFMDPLDNDKEAQLALQALVEAIDARLADLVLQPGDFCFVDNYKAVHGRKPFQARYDGTDRWLKRINITRDLRKSRSARVPHSLRIIR